MNTAFRTRLAPLLSLSVIAIIGPSSTAQAQIGACCLGTGDCIATTESGCTTVMGDYLGTDTDCADAVCIGACCGDNNACDVVSRDDCTTSGGDYKGPASTCFADCPTLVGTTFSYQGQLKQSERPYTGSADFAFSLWRSANGDEQIGGTLEIYDVPVNKGLFTLDIDFGIEVFDGSTRWLEVSVRTPHDPGGTAPFTPLASRQRIAPTPYALQTRGIQSDDNGWLTIGSQEDTTFTTHFGSFRVLDDERYGINLGAGNQQGVISWLNPSGSNAVMRIDATGLGLYRVPATNTLEVNGNASKQTAGSWLSNSDGRIKTDIESVSNATEALLNVNPVSFRYTQQYLKDNPRIADKRYLNVIAQEFASVFPEYVQVSNETLDDGSHIMQVDTYPLIIYSAAAIKELHTRLEKAEKENEALRQRIEAIESKLAR